MVFWFDRTTHNFFRLWTDLGYGVESCVKKALGEEVRAGQRRAFSVVYPQFLKLVTDSFILPFDQDDSLDILFKTREVCHSFPPGVKGSCLHPLFIQMLHLIAEMFVCCSALDKKQTQLIKLHYKALDLRKAAYELGRSQGFSGQELGDLQAYMKVIMDLADALLKIGVKYV